MENKYRNPFTLRASEKVVDDDMFLRFFSPESLNGVEKLYDESKLWHNVCLIQSPPGAGKTTTLRLFTPNILKIAHRYKGGNDEQREIYSTLKRLQVFHEDKISICGVYLLISHDFSYLEDFEIFDNGQSLRIFMALLNARLTLSLLKTIIELKSLNINDLKEIQFSPLDSFNLKDVGLKYPCTGHDIYIWAAGIEEKVCDILDGFSENQKISGHDSIFVFTLFKAEYFKYKGQHICDEFLFELDDAHKFTPNQRKCLLQQVVETRITSTLWIAEREDLLSIQEIVARNNKNGRDYQIINLNERKGNTFKNIARTIADKRSDFSRYNVNLYLGLDDSVNSNYDKKYLKVIEDCTNRINTHVKSVCVDWLKKVEKIQPIKKKAEAYKAISIFAERLINKETIPIFPFTQEQYEEKLSNLLKVVPSLLCTEYKMPLYYGHETLVTLSTNNIEQFIDFSSQLYEKLIAKVIVNKNEKKLDAQEQDKIIKDYSKVLFDSLEKLPMGKLIQKFLKNLTEYCYGQMSGCASYGIVTGFAISNTIGMKKINHSNWYEDNKYEKLREVIRICLANNLLFISPTKQGKIDENWDVYYLNRWLCAYKNIPFNFGGWRKLELATLNKWIAN